jgi:hypothetical protein
MRLEPPGVSPPRLCCRQSIASRYWGQWLVVERETGIVRRIANQQGNQH